MSNELATKPTLPALSELQRIAEIAMRSRFTAYKSADEVLYVLMTGADLGLSPMMSLRGITMVQGKPTLSAALMGAICKSHPEVCEYFVQVEKTSERATYRTKRRGDPAPTEQTFTIDDAKRAGLAGKGIWQQYPAAMLSARCMSALARDVYPDLLLGVYDSDSEEIPQTAPIVEILPRTQSAQERLLDPASTHAAEYPALLPDADQAVIDDLRAKIDAAPTRAALALLMSGVDKSSAIYRVVKHEANAKHASLPAPLGSTPKSANATSSRVTANEPTPDSPQWQRAPLALSVQDDAPRQPGEDA